MIRLFRKLRHWYWLRFARKPGTGRGFSTTELREEMRKRPMPTFDEGVENPFWAAMKGDK